MLLRNTDTMMRVQLIIKGNRDAVKKVRLHNICGAHTY
jgi:hypothetical protein